MPLCVDFNVQQKKTKILNNAAKKRIWEAWSLLRQFTKQKLHNTNVSKVYGGGGMLLQLDAEGVTVISP
jgi:tRNA G37 N-methylase TrmD